MIVNVAVVAKPSHAEQLDGKPERLILPPTPVVAETVEAAILRVGVEQAAKFKDLGDHIGRVQVSIQKLG